MAAELNDRELLARIARRDVDALGALFDRLAPRLLGMVTCILSNRELAEEVVEDTFLKAWSAAPTLLQGHCSLAAWLVIMARHGALIRLRKDEPSPGRSPSRAREGDAGGNASRLRPSAARPRATTLRGAVAVAFPETPPVAWIPGPEEIALVEERGELLQRIVNELPKAQRRALELAVFSGYTEEDIAQEMGEPLGKARTALRAAIAFLRHRRRAVLGTWAANL
jgi:RNA polymerase sigma-70 factor (ECF subfamily)